MARKKCPKSRRKHSGTTETEYAQFAERFVDMMLDPDKPWLLHYFLAGGFAYPVQSSKELALAIVQSAESGSFFAPKEVADAAFEGDRDKLIAIVNDRLRQTKPQKEDLAAILHDLDPSALRRSLREAEGIFKLHRGPNPKISIQKYPELAAWAERLTPVIRKLLTEMQSGSKRPLSDYLEFWKKECPEACSFLLRHLSRLQQALNDPGLLKRGTRIKSRARVLAEALAGSDFGLTFRTSLDRVRTARRQPITAF